MKRDALVSMMAGWTAAHLVVHWVVQRDGSDANWAALKAELWVPSLADVKVGRLVAEKVGRLVVC